MVEQVSGQYAGSFADWMQILEVAGLWVTGGLGALFVWRQNSIFVRQNDIMENQNVTLQNQRELNDLLIKQELARGEDAIVIWCKNVFRHCGNSPGQRQTAGQSLRRRFGTSVPLILRAVEELRNEEPQLKMPSLYDFLKLMNGVESGEWPPAEEYWGKA